MLIILFECNIWLINFISLLLRIIINKSARMKTRFKLSLVLLLLIWEVSLSAAKEETVYNWAYYPPVNEDLYDHLERNFKYPKEAWKKEHVNTLILYLTIGSDGSVKGIEFMHKPFPELEAEVRRVLGMTKWTPARNEQGVNIAVRFQQWLRLTHDPNGFVKSKIPFGLKQTVARAEKTAKRFFKARGMVSAEDLDILKETWELFPESVAPSMAYANILAGMGKQAEGAAAMDSCFRAYHGLYKNVDSIRAKDYKYAIVTRPGYNGRQEIAVALHRALHRMPVDALSADSAFDATRSLIDKRLIDGDLQGDPTEEDISRAQRRVEQLQRDMIMSFSEGRANIELDTPTWSKITRNYTIDELTSSLGYWTEKGEVFSAEISQLHEFIKKEQNLVITGKSVKGERVKLFGPKAFISYMQGGEEGLRGFIEEVRGGDASKQVMKFLERVEYKFAKNHELLADRQKIVAAMTYANPTDSEAKRIRKAAGETFGLDWLYKF